MLCPTCHHTMHQFGCRTSERPFFWCLRCGTTKTCEGDVCAPALVDFCRQFEHGINNQRWADGCFDNWFKLGIAASINLPENRP